MKLKVRSTKILPFIPIRWLGWISLYVVCCFLPWAEFARGRTNHFYKLHISHEERYWIFFAFSFNTFYSSPKEILVDLSDSSKEEATMDIYNIEVTEQLNSNRGKSNKSVPRINFIELLASLGSILGLMLGLGVLQPVQIADDFAKTLMRR